VDELQLESDAWRLSLTSFNSSTDENQFLELSIMK
jgi:hypothetical protein